MNYNNCIKMRIMKMSAFFCIFIVSMLHDGAYAQLGDNTIVLQGHVLTSDIDDLNTAEIIVKNRGENNGEVNIYTPDKNGLFKIEIQKDSKVEIKNNDERIVKFKAREQMPTLEYNLVQGFPVFKCKNKDHKPYNHPTNSYKEMVKNVKDHGCEYW